MLTIRKPEPNRIDLTLDGNLNADDMNAGLMELVDVQNGRLLYTIRNFTMPTLGAIAAEAMNLPAIWTMLRRIDRCAVTSGIAWVRAAAEIEGAVIPGLAVKAFPPEEEAAAEAWLAEGD